jgi:hypothetical protein
MNPAGTRIIDGTAELEVGDSTEDGVVSVPPTWTEDDGTSDSISASAAMAADADSDSDADAESDSESEAGEGFVDKPSVNTSVGASLSSIRSLRARAAGSNPTSSGSRLYGVAVIVAGIALGAAGFAYQVGGTPRAQAAAKPKPASTAFASVEATATPPAETQPEAKVETKLETKVETKPESASSAPKKHATHKAAPKAVVAKTRAKSAARPAKASAKRVATAAR